MEEGAGAEAAPPQISGDSTRRVLKRVLQDLERVEGEMKTTAAAAAAAAGGEGGGEAAAANTGVDISVQHTIATQRRRLSGILRLSGGAGGDGGGGKNDDLARAMRKELRQHGDVVSRVFRKQKRRLQGTIRKLVTGDPKRRVRDHLREAKEQPFYVRLLDKLLFTFWVMNIALSEYFLLVMPQHFHYWYILNMPLLLALRVYRFKKLKFIYFMLDFCYFTQLMCVVQTYLLPWSATMFKVVYLYANGPVSAAVPAWRNSLVFHDIDKVTTVYIHIFPNLLFYATRWFTKYTPMLDAAPLGMADFACAILGYLIWQAAYYYKTEVQDKHKLDSDPEITTSLRWLSRDYKNPLNKVVRSALIGVGVMKKGERFDHSTVKTKVIFICSQLVYTAVTFLPSFLLYGSFALNTIFVLAIFFIAIYNGAEYYIDVFSKRYIKQFERTAGHASTGFSAEADELLGVRSNSAKAPGAATATGSATATGAAEADKTAGSAAATVHGEASLRQRHTAPASAPRLTGEDQPARTHADSADSGGSVDSVEEDEDGAIIEPRMRSVSIDEDDERFCEALDLLQDPQVIATAAVLDEMMMMDEDSDSVSNASDSYGEESDTRSDRSQSDISDSSAAPSTNATPASKNDEAIKQLHKSADGGEDDPPGK